MKEAANSHDFAGYDYSPLEEAKILDFIDKLHELVRKAESDLKKLQVRRPHRDNGHAAQHDRMREPERSELCKASSTAWPM